MALRTPVALLIFNRPHLTRQVFERIREASPERLLIVADGPRGPHEKELCAASRAVAEAVNWPCEVLRNYSDTNLGCRARVSSGLDWVFSECESAIILEDDCLPDPTFFRFCDELLHYYQHNTGVSMIGGSNLQLGRRRGVHSYYFSRYSHVWGWATWRHAWRLYDVNLSAWKGLRNSNWLKTFFGQPRKAAYWQSVLDSVADGFDTWDFQWMFTNWLHGRLSIIPQSNLVSNIGFEDGATHTFGISPYASLPTAPMAFPLAHPAQLQPDDDADQFTFEQENPSRDLRSQLVRSALRLLSRHLLKR